MLHNPNTKEQAGEQGNWCTGEEKLIRSDDPKLNIKVHGEEAKTIAKRLLLFA